MHPNRLFGVITAGGLHRSQAAEYNLFVNIKKIENHPPGDRTLVFWHRSTKSIVVATTATETDMLSWPEWHSRLSHVDFSQNPPSAYSRRELETINITKPSIYRDAEMDENRKKSGCPPNSKRIKTSDVIAELESGKNRYEVADLFGITTAAVAYHVKKWENSY